MIFTNLDKNMARLWRDQGQVNPDGEPQVDRNGIFLCIHSIPLLFVDNKNGMLT